MAKLTFRVWVLIIILVLALLMIAPWKMLDKGVVIKSVERNSTEFESGLRQGMIIKQINGNQINNIEDYTKIVSSIFPVTNLTKIIITTDKQEFVLFTKTLNITLANTPTSNLKTGLDLSGGARALVKPENVSLSSSQISDSTCNLAVRSRPL